MTQKQRLALLKAHEEHETAEIKAMLLRLQNPEYLAKVLRSIGLEAPKETR